MQGTIAQTVALTIHGNAILQGNSDGQAFSSLNSTFVFCESVDFREIVRGIFGRKERTWAANPYTWFERLRAERVHTLQLCYGPSGRTDIADRMLVGFVGGGGEWLIRAIGMERSDFWAPRWSLGDRDRKDKKIWRVSYFRIPGKPSSIEPAEDLTKLKKELRQTLENVAAFSRSQNLDWFTNAFESAIARLESEAPLGGHHPDFGPPGFLSLTANQVLASVEAAWVFGGMGSWNDLGFEPVIQGRYNELSEKLYQLLNRAIVAAANSSIRNLSAGST